MTEITILTKKIIEHYLEPDKLIVITNPNNKIWYCEKLSEKEYLKFCEDIEKKQLITLRLKGRN